MFRPLPSRPSLEYERKQAKSLLRRLRAGDPDAIARARERHGALQPSLGADIPLADAQLVIAREYGFASWPRLVQYYGDVKRQGLALRSYGLHNREFYESFARSLIAEHQHRRPHAGRALAASVPRFYGKTVADVFASSVTEDEARLTVARQAGCASWELLMEEMDADRARDSDPWKREQAALTLARKSIMSGDLDAVMRIVAEHPELLQPTDEDRSQLQRQGIVVVALAAEEKGVAGARAITEWLASQGVDVGLALNERLWGRMFQTTDAVRFSLERGADPNWIAPNGISVLEHAMLIYWNGDAVDLIARRATPKRALWIAAGLGDVDGVSRFLDRNGRPTEAAYRHRPDFTAAGSPTFMLSAPVVDDVEILAEAFFVALLNDRIAVLDYMIDRGFPVDYLDWEMPFVSFAAGNQRLKVVECLVRRGANLDARGRQPDASARDMAREMFENRPTDPTARRILELCGAGDPEQIIAEMEARPAPEPEASPELAEALELAGDDATRRGQADIQPENLLIGMLRGTHSMAMQLMRSAGVDSERLRAEVGTRVLPATDRVDGKPPLGSAAQGLIGAAVAIVRGRKETTVVSVHVLRALCDADNAFLADLLARCGSGIATLRERLAENAF